jgi:sulfate adenylyltransferase subunit 1
LLRIPHLVVAINKMDLVDWSESRYLEVVGQFQEFASRLESPDITFIPISALHGDNVVKRSPRMAWHEGSPLLYTLETLYIGSDANHIDARLPVQTVIRPHHDLHHDYRGFAGRIAGGVFKPGDEIVVLPGGQTTRIKAITSLGRSVDEAFSPMSVEVTLADEIDVSRGDMIAKVHNRPASGRDMEAMVCWFSSVDLQPGGKYIIRHTTRETRCVVKEVRYKVDINTLHRAEGDRRIGLNDIGRLHLRTGTTLFHDSYKRNRVTGSFILIDEFTNATVAAGMGL